MFAQMRATPLPVDPSVETRSSTAVVVDRRPPPTLYEKATAPDATAADLAALRAAADAVRAKAAAASAAKEAAISRQLARDPERMPAAVLDALHAEASPERLHLTSLTTTCDSHPLAILAPFRAVLISE